MQTISVKCKLQVPVELRNEIDRTLLWFAEACHQIYEVAKREKCWNTTKLHHKVYKPVREATGLKANHVCQAIRRVIGNAASVKQVHKFRPTSINLDVRTFQYIEDLQTVGITLMCGRVKFKLSMGNYQLALLKGQAPTAATLNKTKRGDYYINVCVKGPTNPTGQRLKVVGVDLGRRDIATTSTGKSWSGKQIQSIRDRYSFVRANVQSKRTRSSRRLLRRLSGREQRFQKWLNHNISKQLVQEAKLNAEELIIGLFTNCVCLLGIKLILLALKLYLSHRHIQVKPVPDADIFTRLRVSRTGMEKFLSVGIVVLNMMLILMQLIILLLWGSL